MKIGNIDISKIEKKYLIFGVLAVFIIGSQIFGALFGEDNSKPARPTQKPMATGVVKATGTPKKESSAGPVTIIDPPEPPKKNNPNRIILAIWEEEKQEIDPAIEAFERNFPELDVVYKVYPLTEYIDKLSAALKMREEIDAFTVRNVSEYGLFAKEKLSFDVEPLFRSGGMDNSKYGRAFRELKINNKLYGLPYKRNVYMLFYNKSIFDKFQIPLPAKDMTWDGFRNLALQVRQMGRIFDIWGAFMDEYPHGWSIMALQQGASYNDNEFTKFEDAMRYRLQLELDGSIIGFGDQIQQKLHANTEFKKGKIAMHIAGDWHINQLMDAPIDFEWDVSPVPQSGNSNFTIGNYSMICMSVGTSKTENVFKFMKYMAEQDAGRRIATRRHLPAYMSDEMTRAYAEQFGSKPQNINDVPRQDFVLQYPADEKGYSLVNEVFYNQSAKIFNGTLLLKDFKDAVLQQKSSVGNLQQNQN